MPAKDEQKDFDDLVLALAKILVDSLNKKELEKLIPKDEHGEIKESISCLDAALRARGVSGFESYIAFLRKLQGLRSSGAAHRKGSNYRKIAKEFKVESQNLRTVFSGILEKALAFLEFQISTVRSGALSLEGSETTS